MKYDFLEGKVVVLDIDGVMCCYRFGMYTMNAVPEKDYQDYIKNHNPYLMARPLQTFIDLVDEVGAENVYVCSKSYSAAEDAYKKKFVHDHYLKIPNDHIFLVMKGETKLEVLLNEIRPAAGCRTRDMVMIDDSTSNLTEIEDNSDIGCYHISSFLE